MRKGSAVFRLHSNPPSGRIRRSGYRTALPTAPCRFLPEGKGTCSSAGKTGSFEFSNIQSDTEFYIVFESNDSYSFEGYIK